MTLTNNFYIAQEGLRIARKSLKRKLTGNKTYEGSPEAICKAIIQDCYDEDNEYFRVSPNHFNQFYMRDFAWVCDALITLGYKDKVKKTLQYALRQYKKHDAVTTQISPNGRPINFPYHTPESLAYLVHCLTILDDQALINIHKPFIQAVAAKIFNEDIGDDALLRRDKYFSSMKDHSKRISSCYNNCMVAMLQHYLDDLNIKTPLHGLPIQEKIQEKFWTGSYFKDDLSGTYTFSTDANLFPFWTRLFTDQDTFEMILSEIERRDLNNPIPLKYSTDHPEQFHIANWFAPGYEKNTCWTHLGIIYLDLLHEYDQERLRNEISKFDTMITTHHNFLEVFNPDGTPYRAPLYECEESMIWSATYLAIKQQLNK